LPELLKEAVPRRVLAFQLIEVLAAWGWNDALHGVNQTG